MVAYCLIGNIVSIISKTFHSVCWLCNLNGVQPPTDGDIELGGAYAVDANLLDKNNYSI